MSPSSRHVIYLLGLLAFVLAPSPAAAQGGYFGGNKVQYREFKFQVLATEHFDIYFYPEEEEAARLASRMAERWYTRLSVILNHQLRGRQPLILYASGPHFRQTNTIEGELGEGTGGVTEAYKRRIVLPFAGPLAATDHVLGHELVHAFQYDITNTNANSGARGALSMPLWFIEGMAEYLSIGPVDPHTTMWMRDAAQREKLPDIDDLDNPRYFPYRYGHAVWAFIGGRYGDRAVGNLLRAGIGRGGFDDAFKGILGVDSKELTKQWHEAQIAAYRPLAEATKMPAAFAKPLITKETSGGGLNVSPELSPDGSRIMFFSERDLFSIDLFLADARTGKIIRKITDTATDAHFESLQFLSSAGAWDASGKRFVFPGISRGEPVLTIVNADDGRREREIRLKDIDEVLNPAWSPDGKLIAFSGLVGGFNDLFVYDLAADAVRRLTTDAFAELDPAWSPDGRQLAFSTDRFSTRLPALDIGSLRLAAMDIDSGAVREIGGFDGAKNISPQYSADGRTLYFLSDRQGITNVYRTPAEGGVPTQVTNILTGVSGVTALSPALSVANGRLVFSAFEDDGYNIYALDEEAQPSAGALIDLPVNAAVLPPRRSGEGQIFAALENENVGLPAASVTAPVEPYKPRLALDFAGQPTIGVGTDPFGTYAAGGVSFLFSDMLGNHVVATSAQVTSRFDEFGGSVFYLNRKRRWNWGVGVDQTPYVSRGFATGFGVEGGQQVFVENEFRILQVDRGVSGVLAYPFSRAQRFEVSAGGRQIGLKQDVTSRTFDLSGAQLTQDRSDLDSFPTLNLAQASAALVFDTSISGLTSPIRGSRYRLELSQNAGSLSYSGILADVRTYLMPVRPFTFAFRGLYYGRYGGDADDPRLPTMFLGYPGLVRGYDSGSFQAGECGAQLNGSCPAFDRLIGSRVAVGNAELRFPLWGALGGSNFYGPIPVELGVFSDAGIAWGGTSSTRFTDGDRRPVASVGATARINVLGFAVAEINYVRPLDRPGRGWLWQFNLQPGF
ncbi:MAG: BamA/TamA family outer membrane protein [Acidobacteriota bacterium]|nr:BamA/TamA family outer membrane protein [Acidobacteriota bacterium]